MLTFTAVSLFNTALSIATPCSVKAYGGRRNLAEQARQNKGHIDADKMMAIMSTSIEDGGPMHYLTRYQIVAVPEDMALYIYVPCNGKWAKVSLGEYFER